MANLCRYEFMHTIFGNRIFVSLTLNLEIKGGYVYILDIYSYLGRIHRKFRKSNFEFDYYEILTNYKI